MAYSAEILADSPHIYLRLNEVSGTVATDSSGNGRDGVYVNAPTLGVTGLIPSDADTAMQTSGNQQVTVPHALGNNTLSVELWWQWTANGGSEVLWRDDTSSGTTGYFLWVQTTGVTVRIAGRNYLATTQNYRDGLRHHFVVTYDGTIANLFIDGVAVSQWYREASTLPITPFHIGYNGLNSSQYQPGVYDEFALYDTVLSEERVAVHYTEAGGLNPSDAQVNASFLEVAAQNDPQVQVEANFVEVATNGPKQALVAASFLEAVTLVMPSQVSSVYSELVLSSVPAANVESVYSEVVLSTDPAVHVGAVYSEILLLRSPSTGFTGWGVPV